MQIVFLALSGNDASYNLCIELKRQSEKKSIGVESSDIQHGCGVKKTKPFLLIYFLYSM